MAHFEDSTTNGPSDSPVSQVSTKAINSSVKHPVVRPPRGGLQGPIWFSAAKIRGVSTEAWLVVPTHGESKVFSPNFSLVPIEESSPIYKLYGYGLCKGNPTPKIAL